MLTFHDSRPTLGPERVQGKLHEDLSSYPQLCHKGSSSHWLLDDTAIRKRGKQKKSIDHPHSLVSDYQQISINEVDIGGTGILIPGGGGEIFHTKMFQSPVESSAQSTLNLELK